MGKSDRSKGRKGNLFLTKRHKSHSLLKNMQNLGIEVKLMRPAKSPVISFVLSLRNYIEDVRKICKLANASGSRP